MGTEIQEVIDQLVIIQAAITPPSGEKDVTPYDEFPADITTFPAFVNNEIETEILRSPVGGLRIENHLIRMHLLFCAADHKYSQRSRRKWVEAVQDAFEAKITLNGTCTQATIGRIDYGIGEGWASAYVGVAFDLNVETKQTIAYAA